METRAYDITYLDDAMSSLGAMLDYAVNTCGEDLQLFYSRFLSSNVSTALSMANPKYLAGMSGIELAVKVAGSTGDNLPVEDDFIDMGSPEYWTGWTLAYINWYLCIDYRTLQARGVTVQSLWDRYPTLHEADLSKSVRFAQKRLEEAAHSINPLKQARINAGLTQRELAAISNNTIRNIRAWEQGQRSLNNASAASLWRLCHVLGIKPSDILTYTAEF